MQNFSFRAPKNLLKIIARGTDRKHIDSYVNTVCSMADADENLLPTLFDSAMKLGGIICYADKITLSINQRVDIPQVVLQEANSDSLLTQALTMCGMCDSRFQKVQEKHLHPGWICDGKEFDGLLVEFSCGSGISPSAHKRAEKFIRDAIAKMPYDDCRIPNYLRNTLKDAARLLKMIPSGCAVRLTVRGTDRSPTTILFNHPERIVRELLLTCSLFDSRAENAYLYMRGAAIPPNAYSVVTMDSMNQDAANTLVAAALESLWKAMSADNPEEGEALGRAAINAIERLQSVIPHGRNIWVVGLSGRARLRITSDTSISEKIFFAILRFLMLTNKLGSDDSAAQMADMNQWLTKTHLCSIFPHFNAS